MQITPDDAEPEKIYDVGMCFSSNDIAAGGLISYAYSIYTNNTSDPWNIKIWAVILLIIIIVQVIQELGLFISRKLDKRRKIK